LSRQSGIRAHFRRRHAREPRARRHDHARESELPVAGLKRMSSLLWPMLAQIGWTFLLYVLLTVARAQAVGRGEVTCAVSELRRGETVKLARITRNLANQFELPVIFYAVVVLLIVIGRVSGIDVLAAWVFVAGRVIHTLVQTLSDDVVLRGR